MTSKYEPGTVAIATVSGRPNVRAFRTGVPSNMGWEFNRPDGDGHAWHSDLSRSVTDVRPLVVLDVEDWWRLYADLCAAVEACGSGQVSARLSAVAEQVREQAVPPRIPEPGLWGVVEAGAGRIPVRRWVRHEENWWVADTGDRLRWEDLDDSPTITLIRPGVEDESC